MGGTNGTHAPPAEMPPLPFDLNATPVPASPNPNEKGSLLAGVSREERSAQSTGAELGDVLSPSQVNTFLGCPARWYFKYVRELPDPKTAGLGVGSAFHAALKANFKHKLEMGVDLPVEDALAAYGLAWHELQEQTTFADDENPQEIGAMGEALVRVYLEQAAPKIVPVLIEKHLTGVIGGVKVQGYVDLLDARGVIIDSKSAAKSPSGVSANHALQLTTYSMLLAGIPEGQGHSGECRLDTVTKTKTVKYIPQTFHVGAPERRFAENLFPMVQDSLRQGIYYPKRDSFLCSRRQCPFWRACEAEFGGTVDN